MSRTVLAALALVAFVAPVASGASRPGALARSQERGLTIAQTHCAACHGVTANSSSPNPESPTFEDIANHQGLSATTLRVFLRDSHNYPAAMNFTLKSAAARDLANYIVTLKHPGHKPAI